MATALNGRAHTCIYVYLATLLADAYASSGESKMMISQIGIEISAEITRLASRLCICPVLVATSVTSAATSAPEILCIGCGAGEPTSSQAREPSSLAPQRRQNLSCV